MDASHEVRERVERLGRPLNAIVRVLPPSPSTAPAGLLQGVAVAVKDMIDVEGQPRGNGNPGDMAGLPATSDAPIVAALRGAGADVVALSALLEYAAGAQHPDLPEARNPHAPGLTAGGSSGGSAALVGAGAVPLALGTDTGGSIRLPAHYCGVVGYKPTRGTFPVEGVEALAPTLDHVGLLAVDVATTVRAVEALSRIRVAPIGEPLTIGILRPQLDDDRLETDVRLVLEAAIERLERRHVLVDVDSAPLDRLNDVIGAIILFEAWQVHSDAMTRDPEHFGAPTRRLFEEASRVTEHEYRRALAERELLLPAAAALLDGCDVLLGPAGPFVSPEWTPPIDTPEGEVEGIYSGPYNVTGQPAIVLPCGSTPAGLPVGLQLATGFGDDGRLLAAAAAIESELVFSA
jgi:Asp-tRNA(Asn)/Glu-tRNA(Gln) amidotransferase A subunit family amidase